MQPIRLLDLGRIPAWQTQAIYHVLAEGMSTDQQDVIIICRPDAPYLCLGYHQVFESIFDRTECERRGLPVYRRLIGGGATYLDGNQLFYQCIYHHTRMPVLLKDIYSLALAAPVKTLRSLGLNAELCETNEIEVDGKRIAGTGGGRIEEAAVVVGNLLFDFDFEAMTSVWKTPSPAFRLLAEKALHRHIVTLKGLAIQTSPEVVTDKLIESFAESFGRDVQPGTLTPEELCAAEEKAHQLSSTSFLELHKFESNVEPMRPLKISARVFICSDETRVDGYDIRGSFWVGDDVIQAVILDSDPSYLWHPVEQKLIGIPFKEWKNRIHVD
jgi:lipoate-protein ligase A